MSKTHVKKLTLSNIAITDEELNGFDNIEKVNISKKVLSLPKGAFYKKKKLKKVFFDPNIKLNKIPEYCFSFCESLTEVIIPDSVVSIEEKAFCSCHSISQIEIKQTVTYVHPSAFDGWKENQRIYYYKNFEFSDKCKAKLIDIGEEIPSEERVISKESDLTLKKYIVTAKCGHVGRMHYIPIDFPIEATSKKEASRIARQIGRVKHDHGDAILNCRAVSDEEYNKQIEINKKDIYLSLRSKHAQNEVEDMIKHRLVAEPNYKRKK